jgi:hypothetical protein
VNEIRCTELIRYLRGLLLLMLLGWSIKVWFGDKRGCTEEMQGYDAAGGVMEGRRLRY